VIAELVMTKGFDKALESGQAKEKMDPLAFITLTSVFSSFIVASLCEEILKLVCAILVRPEPQDAPYSVLCLSLSSAVGMATLENLGYVFNATKSQGIIAGAVTAIIRAFLSVPLHASTGTIIGADVARRKFHIEKKSIWKVLFIPILLHGMYDFFSFFMSQFYEIEHNSLIYLMGLGVLSCSIAAIFLAIRQINAVKEYDQTTNYSSLPLTMAQG